MVYAKQPGKKGDSLILEHAQPVKAGYIVVRDLCTFHISSDIRICWVLQLLDLAEMISDLAII